MLYRYVVLAYRNKVTSCIYIYIYTMYIHNKYNHTCIDIYIYIFARTCVGTSVPVYVF